MRNSNNILVNQLDYGLIDCVCQDYLLQKLYKQGIRDVPLNWISSFLTYRLKFVSVNDRADFFLWWISVNNSLI